MMIRDISTRSAIPSGEMSCSSLTEVILALGFKESMVLAFKLKVRALVGGNERIQIDGLGDFPLVHDHQRVAFHHPSMEPSLRPKGQLVGVVEPDVLQALFVEDGSGDGVDIDENDPRLGLNGSHGRHVAEHGLGFKS